MPRIKLTVEYDGTAYVGWQVQPNGRSIQGELMRALSELIGESVTVEAAGRTDAGVHALGQVAAFNSPRELPMKAYWRGLNGLLPKDIAVVEAEEVDDTFDPRRSASGKRYRYLISNRRTRSPLRRFTHWEVFSPLDHEAMQRALTPLLGRHDFSSFRAANCEAKHAVRELRELTVRRDGEVISVDVAGTAFLKHMVRNLVGSAVEVGVGKQPPEWMAQVLAARDRTQAGPTAPPQGLTLVRVEYGKRTPASELAGDEGES